ncbi:hypothetical protein TraAM80_02405 [Trypanosoma rangeli]|uniref:Uncharacterized protein n=1 Tax=Trypanosoma rangeli TaxID=5698 RepID=A0A3S5IRW6_TRYRA|nr:uncharacterized protein TraAM80_02405 [Trypanosoma rangeli]RNF09146.1 hypothetical protein TraAM80_02405 [Trypanosoma rangeli]|eukprot:RNF09146.1 hypothetical protein TraAM80_02405 [Trypanosoma rangeli]
MPTEVAEVASSHSNKELVGQLISHGGCSASSASGGSSGGGAMSRLVTFVDNDGATSTTYSISENGGLDSPPQATRISFDMLGVVGLSEDMLAELYEAFDVHQRGGVERSLMRELMKTGFSNYGAPRGDKEIDRLFEHITPYNVRRRLKEGKDEDDLMPFNEFCAVFLSWLRL